MLNKIWPFFILISILYAIISGNVENLNNSIFECTETAIGVVITLVGTMALWSGIMNILSKTTLINKLCKLLEPIINILFPDLKGCKEIKKKISMNMVANVMGLGNAATPIGINAIKSMDVNNKDKSKLSNSMMMLILINTASLQIIPTTVIAIRKSLGSSNPSNILIPVWCATVCAAISGVVCLKIITKKGEK